jgi:hypothetical protein
LRHEWIDWTPHLTIPGVDIDIDIVTQIEWLGTISVRPFLSTDEVQTRRQRQADDRATHSDPSDNSWTQS